MEKIKVFVLNWHDKPLMPCSPSKAKKLVARKKAVWVDGNLPTIRLTGWSNGYKQPVTLGIDAGSRKVGFSATTEKEELLSGTAALRTDVSENIATKKELRRARRGRKTRGREARFDNRLKGEGWFAPSIEQKMQSHLRLVRRIKSILPITAVIVEVAPFDIRKIKNPDIRGEEYQQGEQAGFFNVREYVLCRDNHTCRHCHGKSKDKVLEVHHIESRKTGGDAPNNLVTLCKTCHETYHRGKIDLKLRRGMSYRDASAMNTMRWELAKRMKEEFGNVNVTYGYITKSRRIGLGLSKGHHTDAFCIANNLTASRDDKHYVIRFIRRHTRSLHVQKPAKGGKRRAATAPYYIGGTKFTKYDKVRFNGRVCFISGSSGGYVYLRDINWEKAEGCKSKVSTKRIRLICHHKGSMIIG